MGADATGGADLAAGVTLADLADGSMLLGHVGEEKVLLARRNGEFFAVGAVCTHYSGPLAEGLMVEETVRCPWHHACFSLRTGEALRAPALKPVDCWRVEQANGLIYVREKLGPGLAEPILLGNQPGNVVIIGGGAAGFAAAEMLRRKGYDGYIKIISADEAAPYDRPNLSKDYLAGTAPEDWLPLRSARFYERERIELVLGVQATKIDTSERFVELADGRRFAFLARLIAPGAEPRRLAVPGADLAHVHTLRSLADSRAIIAKAQTSRNAVIVGASFIGLEVAASLRSRGLAVHVVAPESRPMERILGPELGDFIKALHESHGVNFHLGQTVASIGERQVVLGNGVSLEADLVVVGIGVQSRTELAEAAGLAIDRGIAVGAYLETNVPGIYAAGDVARWPDPHSRESIRVEHWVVAERQGQAVARNILGAGERFDAVPFFWSQHYDVVINYVGHAESWDEIQIDGSLDARDCALRYLRGGRLLAVATIFRDRESLEAEIAMERELVEEAFALPV